MRQVPYLLYSLSGLNVSVWSAAEVQMEDLGEFPKSASYGQKNHVIYREQGLKRLIQKRGREGSSWNPPHCNQAKPQEQMK